MNNLKTIHVFRIGCWLAVTLIAFPVQAQTELFSHLHIQAQAGGIVPAGELNRILDEGALFGLRATSPYYRKLQVHTEVQYALLDGETSPRAVYYVKAGLGMGYQPPAAFLPMAGLGVSGYFVRSAEKRDNVYRFLDENESEFGLYPFLHWQIPIGNKFFLQVGAAWDMIFTQPFYSHLPSAHLGAGWIWW